jgi:hypothetical protein
MFGQIHRVADGIVHVSLNKCLSIMIINIKIKYIYIKCEI